MNRPPTTTTITAPDACRRILTDRNFDVVEITAYFRHLQQAGGLDLEPVIELSRRMPFFINGPEHGKIRKAWQPFFRNLHLKIREDVAAVSIETAKRLPASGEIDLAEHFVGPLTSLNSCRILGLPEHLHLTFHKWGDEIRCITEPLLPLSQVKQINGALIKFRKEALVYAETGDASPHSFMAFLRSTPGELSSVEEATWAVIAVFLAGLATTHTLSNLILRIAQMPFAQRSELARTLRVPTTNGDLPAGFENLLHKSGAGQYLTRIDRETVTHDGHTYQPNDRVHLRIADARAGLQSSQCPFADAHAAPTSPDLAFGAGLHRCPGEGIAKIVIRSAIAALLDRFPRYTIDPQRIAWTASQVITGPLKLPCILDS